MESLVNRPLMHVPLDYASNKVEPSVKYSMKIYQIEHTNYTNVFFILPQVASMDNSFVSLDNRFSYLDR